MSSKVNIDELKHIYIGNIYGWLTIIDVVHDNRIKFICRCKCGTIKHIDKNKVLRGDIISCGCYTKTKLNDNLCNLKNEYIGKTFNWLTIIDLFREDSLIKVKCKCKCGNDYITTLNYVKSGHNKSCGCYRKSKEKAEKYKEWCKNNPDKIANKELKRKKFYIDHPEKIIEKVEKYKEWRFNNQDKIKQLADQHSKWWQNNKQLAIKLGKQHSQWLKDNPDKVDDIIFNRKQTMSIINMPDIYNNNSKLYYNKRINIINNLKTNPTHDFIVFLNILHESQTELLLNGNIKSHDTIITKCPRCGNYCGHILKNTFAISKGIFKHGSPPMCNNCVYNFKASKDEQEIADFISTFYSGECIRNSRNIISPQELDLYYPEKKIAIEFNGDYFHSDNNKPRDYHYNKFKLCKENNILLVSIFESAWLEKKDHIKSYLTDIFNGIENKLSYNEKATLMDNNYPSNKYYKMTLDYIEDCFIYRKNHVYTCGYSVIPNV